MDHVVVAIHFVGFLGWFAWLLTQSDKADPTLGSTAFPQQLLAGLILGTVSYALLLTLFYGASWLVVQGIDAMINRCIGTGC